MRKELKFSNKIVTIVLCILALIIGITFNIKYQIIIVSGDSMLPSLKSGNLVLIDKRSEEINYNDIIVFKNDETNIKRIIALPGDLIELSNKHIFVNGVQIKPYTYDGENKIYQLGEDEYFVLGDNYLNSYDSRDYGPIQKVTIIGKVIVEF